MPSEKEMLKGAKKLALELEAQIQDFVSSHPDFSSPREITDEQLRKYPKLRNLVKRAENTDTRIKQLERKLRKQKRPR